MKTANISPAVTSLWPAALKQDNKPYFVVSTTNDINSFQYFVESYVANSLLLIMGPIGYSYICNYALYKCQCCNSKEKCQKNTVNIVSTE